MPYDEFMKEMWNKTLPDYMKRNLIMKKTKENLIKCIFKSNPLYDIYVNQLPSYENNIRGGQQ